MAVRLGDRNARLSYVLLLAIAILLPLALVTQKPWILLVLLLIPATLVPSWVMLSGKTRKALIPVLKQTGLINLGFSVLYGLAMVLPKLF